MKNDPPKIENLLSEIVGMLKGGFGAREIMDFEDLAEYTGLSVSSLREMRATYGIPFHKVGGRIMFRKKRIDAWLDDLVVNSAADERRLNDGRRKGIPFQRQSEGAWDPKKKKAKKILTPA